MLGAARSQNLLDEYPKTHAQTYRSLTDTYLHKYIQGGVFIQNLEIRTGTMIAFDRRDENVEVYTRRATIVGCKQQVCFARFTFSLIHFLDSDRNARSASA